MLHIGFPKVSNSYSDFQDQSRSSRQTSWITQSWTL